MKRQPAIAVAVSGPPRCSAAVAWVMLDWAASAFSTMQITLIVAYVERVVFADKAWGLSGGVVWAWTMAVAMLAPPWAASCTVRLISPVVADCSSTALAMAF